MRSGADFERRFLMHLGVDQERVVLADQEVEDDLVGLLAAISFLPLKRMSETNQFTFWSTDGFYKDTILTMANGATGTILMAITARTPRLERRSLTRFTLAPPIRRTIS